MFMNLTMAYKLYMARTTTYHAWINNNKLGKSAKHVNNLPGTFYSKSRARLTQARVLHKCKQRHGWIEHYKINKKILTDHPQKRHGSLGNNMNIWHKNNDRART